MKLFDKLTKKIIRDKTSEKNKIYLQIMSENVKPYHLFEFNNMLDSNPEYKILENDELISNKEYHIYTINNYINKEVEKDIIGMYFDLCDIFNMFYKFREDEKIQKCLLLNAQKQVELFLIFENFAKIDLAEYESVNKHIVFYYNNKWNTKMVNCFKNLCTILLLQNRFDDANKVCEKAMELGYNNDGTKSGMEGRKKRILSKIKK